jgi:hypothetical protein
MTVAPSAIALRPDGSVADLCDRRVADEAPQQTSALASSSLHLARSTNIDRRFSVGASRLAEQASRNSSSAARHMHEAGLEAPLGRAEAGQAGTPGRVPERRW